VRSTDRLGLSAGIRTVTRSAASSRKAVCPAAGASPSAALPVASAGPPARAALAACLVAGAFVSSVTSFLQQRPDADPAVHVPAPASNLPCAVRCADTPRGRPAEGGRQTADGGPRRKGQRGPPVS